MKTLIPSLILSLIIHIIFFIKAEEYHTNNNINFSAKQNTVMVSIMQSSKGVVTDHSSINSDDENQTATKSAKQQKQLNESDTGKHQKKQEEKKQTAKNAKKGGYSHNDNKEIQEGYASYVPAPKYPLSSRRNKEEGTVVFNIMIDSSGKLVKYNIVASSGYKKLDIEAEKAVKHAKFHPAYKKGEAVTSSIELKITFKIQG